MDIPISMIVDKCTAPFDEGIKNTVFNIILHSNIMTGTQIGRSDFLFNIGKTCCSMKLASHLRHASSNVIVYFPYSSLTLASFFRTRIIKILSGWRPVIIAGLQSRHRSKFVDFLIKTFLTPDGIVVSSRRMGHELLNMSAFIDVFYPGVDTRRFRPCAEGEKGKLRQKYEIPDDAFVVLHVGHIKKSRNIERLIDIKKAFPEAYVIVVASSTTDRESDGELKRALQNAEVRVYNEYIEHVEEIYRLGDCYVFPVESPTGSAEMPLSVLEAMGSNLFVITSPFGALPEVFEHNPSAGFYFASRLEETVEYIQLIRKQPSCCTAMLVAPLDWKENVKSLLARIRKRFETHAMQRCPNDRAVRY